MPRRRSASISRSLMHPTAGTGSRISLGPTRQPPTPRRRRPTARGHCQPSHVADRHDRTPLFPPPPPHGRAHRAPLPIYPLYPAPPSRLKSCRPPLCPLFFAPFPSHPCLSTRFLHHLPHDPMEQLERWEPSPRHRNWPQCCRQPALSVSCASKLAPTI
jgi:hypothetical protein